MVIFPFLFNNKLMPTLLIHFVTPRYGSSTLTHKHGGMTHTLADLLVSERVSFNMHQGCENSTDPQKSGNLDFKIYASGSCQSN